MRRLICTILIAFAWINANSQTTQILGAPGTRIATKGDMSVDSILYLPRTLVTSRTPTQAGALRYQSSDSALYQWTGTAWRKAGGGDVDTLLLSTRAWRQKGIDSVASVRIGGSGVTGYIPKFTAARTLDSSQIFQQGGNIGIATNNPVQRLQVNGMTLTTSLVVDSVTGLAYNSNWRPLGGANHISGVTHWWGRTSTISPVVGGGDFTFFKVRRGDSALQVGDEIWYDQWNGKHRNGTFNWEQNDSSRLGNDVLTYGLHQNFTPTATRTFSFKNTSGVMTEYFGILPVDSTVRVRNASFNVSKTSESRMFLTNTTKTASELMIHNNENFLQQGVEGATAGSRMGGTLQYGSYFGSYANYGLTLHTNNAARMTILANGRVVVGGQSDAGYQFDVAGSMRNTTSAAFATSTGSLSVGTTTADIFSRFDDRYLTLSDATGNVALSINAGASAGRGAQIYLGTGAIRYFTFGANINDSYFGTATAIPMRFEIQAAEAMRLNTGRELLIGTTADSGFFKLQVQGNIFLPQNQRIQIGQPVDTTRSISAIGNQFQVSVNLEEFNNGNSGPDLFIRRGRGTVAQKADIDSGTRIGAVDYQGYSNGNWYSALALLGETSKADTVGNVIAADFVILQPFSTTTLSENMRLFANGGHLRVTGGLETGAPSGGSQKRWKIGEAATVSPTSPNRTLRVEVDGTVYYIHAKTTND